MFTVARIRFNTLHHVVLSRFSTIAATTTDTLPKTIVPVSPLQKKWVAAPGMLPRDLPSKLAWPERLYFRASDIPTLFKHLCPERFTEGDMRRMQIAATVWPFRVNQHVVKMIDWSSVPNDPIFRLVFPQIDALPPEVMEKLESLYVRGAPKHEINALINRHRMGQDPNTSGQDLNIPFQNGEPVKGMQHKYTNTALLFPPQGQSCHSICSYCFRWPQFIAGMTNFSIRDIEAPLAYLRAHTEVSDILITGGDAATLPAAYIQALVNELMKPEYAHIQSLRMGTKSLAYWPKRWTTDLDADALLNAYEQWTASGRALSIMAHSSHVHEWQNPDIAMAVQRIRQAGGRVLTQAPVIRGVNDSADAWAAKWRAEVKNGATPYYMFIARDTGPKGCFDVPLVRALEIYKKAHDSIPGVMRTATGPVMSATPGKVQVLGVTGNGHNKAIVLNFVQARDLTWRENIFFARYDDKATWLTGLKPLFGDRFDFEPGMDEFRQANAKLWQAWQAKQPPNCMNI